MAIDPARWRAVSPYLDQALVLSTGDRASWLATVQIDDPTLAGDLRALLADHDKISAERFLEDGAPALPAPMLLCGMTIGAYALVEPIGHGGMGSVWLAARSDGRFEGHAAVKLLNPDRLGPSAVARFVREGTILSRLTHPHIAALFDAGVSATGQPYLILEHVAGQHLDRHCDHHALSLRDRIALFLDVLAAVAHAHANLIVHRDLKPSNVLVTADGQVKLLDFGIAKLLGDDEQSLSLTREADAGLTPRYAAPEQVSGGAISTATDVYALGVLLHELLSGRNALGSGVLSAADIVQAIVHTEPPPMSAAMAADDATPGVREQRALARATTPEKLQRALAGDLDTIVAKALKKDPAERYASVAEFADDLRRFLEDEPIRARPDTLAYRAAKFGRRHRRVLAVAVLALAVVSGTIAVSTVRLARERDVAARQAAKASKVSALLTEILGSADPFRTPDAQEPTVRRLLDLGAERIARDLSGQPDVQAEVLTSIGRVYQRLGAYDKAQPTLERALTLARSAGPAEEVTVAAALNELGVLRRERGDLVTAQSMLEESLAMRRRLLGSIDKDVAVTAVELARVLRDRGFDAKAEPLIRESLSVRRAVFGPDHREVATSINDLALLVWQRGDLKEAERLFRESLAINIRRLGHEHPSVGSSKGNLALVLAAQGHPADAEALFREQLTIYQRTLGERHPSYAHSLNNLSRLVFDQGRIDEARTLIEQALAIVRPILPDDNPRVAAFIVMHARVQIAQHQAREAESALWRVLDLRRRIYPAGDWRIGQVESVLGAALMANARYAEAEPLLQDAANLLNPASGPQMRDAAETRARLADVSLFLRGSRSLK